MAPQLTENPFRLWWPNIRTTLYILGSVVLFLFALNLLVFSLQHLGQSSAETIILATSNPFTGLFIGLLITAMIQSSSTTTALVVAFVASGSLTLESAVPIIMGANVGTTITSTIVSLGFLNSKKEFKRAVSAGTYHDFFNILTVAILFPLEYYYQFLSKASSHITTYFFTTTSAAPLAVQSQGVGSMGGMVEWTLDLIQNGFILVLVAFTLLFGSILLFRRLISDLLLEKSHERLGQFFFQSQGQSFAWGLATTAAIRSSTITTSLVVPLVAKRIIKLRQAAPFIIGANIGTTITAFIAAILYSNTSPAITIALAHFLFNFIGFLIFFPIPILKKIPFYLANALGKLTLRYRLAGFVYLLSTFFFIPFCLIYLNRDSVETTTIVYETRFTKSDSILKSKLISRLNLRTKNGQWIEFSPYDSNINIPPSKIHPISYRNKMLFTKESILMFNKPGFCWDGEDEVGKYQCCVDSILPRFEVMPAFYLDSVYVYQRRYYGDSTQRKVTFYTKPHTPILKQVISDSSGVLETQRILLIRRD